MQETQNSLPVSERNFCELLDTTASKYTNLKDQRDGEKNGLIQDQLTNKINDLERQLASEIRGADLDSWIVTINDISEENFLGNDSLDLGGTFPCVINATFVASTSNISGFKDYLMSKKIGERVMLSAYFDDGEPQSEEMLSPVFDLTIRKLQDLPTGETAPRAAANPATVASPAPSALTAEPASVASTASTIAASDAQTSQAGPQPDPTKSYGRYANMSAQQLFDIARGVVSGKSKFPQDVEKLIDALYQPQVSQLPEAKDITNALTTLRTERVQAEAKADLAKAARTN